MGLFSLAKDTAVKDLRSLCMICTKASPPQGILGMLTNDSCPLQITQMDRCLIEWHRMTNYSTGESFAILFCKKVVWNEDWSRSPTACLSNIGSAVASEGASATSGLRSAVVTSSSTEEVYPRKLLDNAHSHIVQNMRATLISQVFPNLVTIGVQFAGNMHFEHSCHATAAPLLLEINLSKLKGTVFQAIDPTRLSFGHRSRLLLRRFRCLQRHQSPTVGWAWRALAL